MMIRRLLYAFKRQWGMEMDYVQILSSVADDRTGDRVIERNFFHTKAVRLPQAQTRKFIQDIGYLAADKNFTYGALNDYNKITIIFDRYEFPEDFNPDLDGYVVLDGKRYERVSILNLFNEAYVMIAQGVVGANPYARLVRSAFSKLQIQGRAVYELN